MLSLLRTNNPLNYILIFVLMAVFWGYKFVFMPVVDEDITFLNFFNFNYADFPIVLKYIFSFIAFLFYSIFAFYLIQINLKLFIVESAYQIVGIFFVLFSGIFINFQTFTTDLLVSILIFISIFKILSLYKKERVQNQTFDVGFLFAITLIIDIKYCFFLPLFLIILIIIKNLTFKEIIAFFLGITAPLLIYFTILLFYFKDLTFLDHLLQSLSEIITNISFINKYNKAEMIVYFPFLIIALINIIWSFLFKQKNILSSKSQTILLISMMFILIFFFLPTIKSSALILFFAPLSVFFSKIFVNLKNKSQIIMFYGILIMIVLMQIIQILF